MSFLIQPPIPERLNRCQLFGPGSRPELFEKMASSQADVINLDLEDSVALCRARTGHLIHGLDLICFHRTGLGVNLVITDARGNAIE